MWVYLAVWVPSPTVIPPAGIIPRPCIVDSLVSTFASIVAKPIILLNHLPSFSLNSRTWPDCPFVSIELACQPLVVNTVSSVETVYALDDVPS